MTQGGAPSVTLTKEDFAKDLKLIPTSPELWNARQNPSSADETKLRQRKTGESRWLATVSRLGICSGSARRASRVNAFQGSDAYRINDLVRTGRAWQKATILKYASPPHQKNRERGAVDEEIRTRGGRAGWSDAAYGDQSVEGKCFIS